MSVDIELKRRRFTLDEYHRMAEVGILNEDDRLELIRGDIVQMSPIGSRHASCVARITALLVGRLGDRAVLWPQNPLIVLPDSEPQPDIILLRYREDYYRHALPQPEDVALLIEVTENSLRYDRRVKGSLYAEAGVRDYWIVDLDGDAIEIHRDPTEGTFRVTERIPGGTLTPLAFSDISFTVDTILG
jgi:Uma2 family endonuclease